MLKKGLLAVILMLSAATAHADLPVGVGNIRDIGLLLDIGYYFHVQDQTPMVLERVATGPDPYRTYEACRTTTITCNFRLMLTAQVHPTSAAEGRWTASYSPQSLSEGTTTVEFCVRGEGLQIERLTGGTQVKVAELRIGVIPR